MFNWFKRKPKKVQILVVVDGDAHEPIDYSNKIDVDLATEVRAACNALAIKHDDNLIEDIAAELDHGRSYWHNESYCFDIITVEM